MQRRMLRRRRAHLTAPRLTVRAQTTWRGRMMNVVLMLALIGGCSWVAYLAGRLTHGEFQGITVQDVFAMRQQLSRLTNDNRLLLKRSVQSASLREVDEVAQSKLEQQLGALEKDNQALRAQLGLFEEMLKRPDRVEPLRIAQFTVLHLADGQWRFHALLTQGSQSQGLFAGRYQLSWQGKDGQTIGALPQGGDDRYRLQFRHLQRLEGTLPPTLPPGARLTLAVLPPTGDQPVASMTVIVA